MKEEFLREISNDAGYEYLFSQAALYEEEFGVPLHEFTGSNLCSMFARERWERSNTFRRRKSQLLKYFDWLEGQGIKTSYTRMYAITEDNVVGVSKSLSYFGSFDEMRDAFVAIFPIALTEHMYVRELLCLILSAIGLDRRQILSLEMHNVDVDHASIAIGDVQFQNIPRVFMDILDIGMRADTYSTTRGVYKFEASPYVVKRPNIAGQRDEIYIKNLLYNAVKIAKKMQGGTVWEHKSFLPKDLGISYMFICIANAEDDGTIDLDTSYHRVVRRVEEFIATYNGTGFADTPSARNYIIGEYQRWKSYHRNLRV